LVEKTRGWFEARVATTILFLLETHVRSRNLGVVVGSDGMVTLFGAQVRIPDAAYYSWARFPDGKLPREPIPPLAPDLAVEVLSKSNTPAEMDRKLDEYFDAGALLVWYIDPADRSVRAFTAVDQFEELRGPQLLGGGTVLPGFSASIDELFAQAEGTASPPHSA
jgi:Uma2 family endonuclease